MVEPLKEFQHDHVRSSGNPWIDSSKGPAPLLLGWLVSEHDLIHNSIPFPRGLSSCPLWADDRGASQAERLGRELGRF